MEELIKRALKGDKNAYIELIESMDAELVGLAMIKLKNREDVNDVIQETIIKSYHKLHTLKDYSKFESWIKRILINECMDIYRAKKIQDSIFVKIVDGEVYSEYDLSMEKVEEDIDFQEFLKGFEHQDRIILTLHYAQHCSANDIAMMMGINVNTVKSRLNRAKKKIKELNGGRLIYE